MAHAPAAGLCRRPSSRTVEVTGVTHDSRAVGPGMVFVAVPGLRVDGHDFVPAAIEAGAAGVIVERPIPGVAAPQIVVDASRPALGHPRRPGGTAIPHTS